MEEAELIRLGTVITAVRAYFMVFDSYEKYAELEERIRRLEEDIGQDLEKDYEIPVRKDLSIKEHSTEGAE